MNNSEKENKANSSNPDLKPAKDLLHLAYRSLTHSKIDKTHALIFVGILSISAAVSYYLNPEIHFTSFIANVLSLCINGYVALLGFVIAAFTIFISNNNLNFLEALYEYTPKHKKCSLLELHIYVYIKNLIANILALILSLVLYIITNLYPNLSLLNEIVQSHRLLITIPTTVIIVAMPTYVFIQLLNLVFDLYHGTLTHIQYNQAQKPNDDANK